jgi:hypothetical protein
MTYERIEIAALREKIQQLEARLTTAREFVTHHAKHDTLIIQPHSILEILDGGRLERRRAVADSCLSGYAVVSGGEAQ